MKQKAAKSAPNGESERKPVVGRIWREYLRPRWPYLLFAALCGVGIAGVTGVLTQVLRPAVDQLLGARNAHAALVIPLEIVGLAVTRGVLQVLQARTVNRAGHTVVGDMQVQLFGKLIRADLARLRSEHTGTYVSSVIFDANLIRQAFTDGIIAYVRESLTVVAMVAVMFWNDATMAAASLIGAPIVIVVMRRFAKRTSKATRGAMAETAKLSTAVMEGLDGVKIVKIENRESDEEAHVREVVERRQTHVIKSANAKAFATPSMETITMIVVAGVLALAAWRARAGGLTAGGFTAFLVAMLAASTSLRLIANLQTVFSEGLAAARRLFDALDIEPEVREPAKPALLPNEPAVLRVDNVVFAYHPGAQALAGVTLEARPGETVALVGPSGGGKSTILNLIPRFYDPDGGRISLNEVDVRDAALADLRSKIALVTQEPFLFDDTIRANIAYARPNASETEIVTAAEAAAAHEFISMLPEGYATRVGEAGVRLSGGQRQRIAIARAFLKDAPILLLDEATSALDTESEAKVQVALERLMQGRTTLLIAHRLSTVRGADRIYVIDQGRVVEQGSHATLMKMGGLYARLAGSQDLETVGGG
jgi:subfamily B ATP-binding cassette protein MsbA